MTAEILRWRPPAILITALLFAAGISIQRAVDLPIPLVMSALATALMVAGFHSWRRRLRSRVSIISGSGKRAAHVTHDREKIRGAGATLVASLFARFRFPETPTLILLLAGLCTGMLLWERHIALLQGHLLKDLLKESDLTVRLSGRVLTIPSSRSVRQDIHWRSGAAPDVRTAFMLQVHTVLMEGRELQVTDRLHVLVEGETGRNIVWGDEILATGTVSFPAAPLNPGELDFREYHQRQGTSGFLFVRHAAAVQIVHHSSRTPCTWLSHIRFEISELIRRHMSGDARATAEALILGNRGHLQRETEDNFVVSGTMHLLAISGLHVGILYLFVSRCLNLLLASRTTALVGATTSCILYAFATDLRPSVARATCFFCFYTVSQLLNREFRMSSLIGCTAFVLILANPAIVLDTGAWLSFLAVSALAVSSLLEKRPSDSLPPLDAESAHERLLTWIAGLRPVLLRRYRQIVSVTIAAGPLVAAQFHVVSVTGAVINVVLIPLTSLTLICGFLFLGTGLVWPAAAAIPGFLFECLVNLLNSVVTYCADQLPGHIHVAEIAAPFLWVYYISLSCGYFSSGRLTRRTGLTLAAASGLAMLYSSVTPPVPTETRLTILSVGHGNAAVLESAGRIILFDAGATNRGERTADVIAGFLRMRGYRAVDSVILSHADLDHYNALATLAEQVPVGQILTSADFVRSPDAPVNRLLDRLCNVPTQIVCNGDYAVIGDTRIEFLQAQDTSGLDDNERSLVVVLRVGQRTVLLPGDLEHRGLAAVRDQLPDCDVVICPHHGSTDSSPPEFAGACQPEWAIVSERAIPVSRKLRAAYGDGCRILHTGHDGAVSIIIDTENSLAVSVHPMVRTRDDASTPVDNFRHVK
ncbi:MAG: DNA internalization-related competence protein ComEC/Rec2 [Planctomycetaceae bacterium]|nr:DNA internalization-related competence protein ComEC/Rec2 [Planctomycetaceae bacterium]